AHALVRVAARELEHRGIERVEAGQRHELEAVAELREILLEGSDLRVVEVLAPVERRRAVVGEQLARELLVDGLRELARLAHVRRRGLEPDEVGVRRGGAAAGDGRVQTLANAEEAFGSALAGQERLVER